MKIRNLLYLITAGLAMTFMILSCAHTQAVSPENPQAASGEAGVIAPPEAGTEAIAIPQTGSIESVPIPGQAAGTAETQAAENQPGNMPTVGGVAPTAGEQPLLSEGEAPPALPGPISEQAQAQTPTALPPLPTTGTQQPAEQLAAPSPEVAPAPPGGLAPLPLEGLSPSPSSELAPLPSAAVTSPTVAPMPEAPVQPEQPAIVAQPFTAQQMPVAQQPVPPSPAAEAPAPAQEMASIPQENVPAPTPQTAVVPEVEKITRPPMIVPGEVISGMPAYVNTKTTHIVREGEDLHWLAAVYYGNARLWEKIYQANRAVIKDPNHLVVGTKLVIPPK